VKEGKTISGISFDGEKIIMHTQYAVTAP